jgi:hypothetical protein
VCHRPFTAPASSYTATEIGVSQAKGVDVHSYAFRYNHCDDGQAMFSAACSRTQKVSSGKHGGYSPIGKRHLPMDGKGV